MDDRRGGGKDRSVAEELVLRTIAAHAESLLRTARRHSLCLDDAQDAYQRALEIFMAKAERLDAGRAPAWLHVVVKREAQAIRKSRQRLVSTATVDLDERPSAALASPEEQLLALDTLTRAAEALKRLKPQELRALWLKAQGHSYSDIGAITGWSYTKVNRCVVEGRRAFLERYAGIESGEECLRWRPVISAMVDGEANPEQLLELRPHLRNCPGCRATLKALRDSREPLAALFPIPLAVLDAGTREHVSNAMVRVYESVTGGVHERAVHSATKLQTVLEAATTGKIAAVAASAAAAAGGGLATVQRVVDSAPDRPSKHPVVHRSAARHARAGAAVAAARAPVVNPPPAPADTPVSQATTPPPPADPKPAAQAASGGGEFDVEQEATPSAGSPARSAASVPVHRSAPARSGRSAAATADPSPSEFGP